MPTEPDIKRAFVYVDGQNLFHAAREAFGYTYPNYDVVALAQCVCRNMGWQLTRTHFYTGIPDRTDDAHWHDFWTAKLAAMGRTGVEIFTRALRYSNRQIRLPDGSTHSLLVGQEKGIDIRIALDIVHAVRSNECDVVIIFSQDQDMTEVADEIRMIAGQQNRWVKIVTFPTSPTCHNRRGINKTDWIRVDRRMYDSCTDASDYRPRKDRTAG
jgi:uncharacterized LabA/DUF88 family protein